MHHGDDQHEILVSQNVSWKGISEGAVMQAGSMFRSHENQVFDGNATLHPEIA